jgi:transposase
VYDFHIIHHAVSCAVSKELTKKEIYERMIAWRNLKKLHQAARDRVATLESENKYLRQVLKERDARITELEDDFTTLKLQIEELRAMVFRKRKKKDSKEEDIDNTQDGNPRTPSLPRTKRSRPIPTPEEVTEEVTHTLNTCTCGETLCDRTTRTYYEEDIPLNARVVRKHTIEVGYCTHCKKRVSAIPLPCADVVLGETVKRYVTYLSVVCRLSYSQIRTTLKDVYTLSVSDGEIAHILKREGACLRPFYERLLESIRGEPSVHLDETSWLLFIGDGYRRYAWVMVGGVSGDAVYVLGKTRGKGNALDLLGDSTAVVVSDDYGAYRRLLQAHQLCCAHILRKLRDIAESRELAKDLRAHCVQAYHLFAEIYAAIVEALHSNNPKQHYEHLFARLTNFAIPHVDDPKKVTNVRIQIRERTACYLTCLLHPHVIADNNPAERALRPLVQKRRVSFGSMNETSAEVLGVLTSVLYTLRQRGALGKYLRGEVVGV